MTRPEIQRTFLVVQAFAAGKNVQYKYEGVWHDVDDPTFHAAYEWRIKPEPREFTVAWVPYLGKWVITGETPPRPGCPAQLKLKVREVTD